MNRRGQIGPLAMLAMLGSVGGVPAVQAAAQRARYREELVMRARMLGVRQPEIHDPHVLEAEIEAQLRGPLPALMKEGLAALKAMAPAPGTSVYEKAAVREQKRRALAEKKARRAKRKQRRQR